MGHRFALFFEKVSGFQVPKSKSISITFVGIVLIPPVIMMHATLCRRYSAVSVKAILVLLYHTTAAYYVTFGITTFMESQGHPESQTPSPTNERISGQQDLHPHATEFRCLPITTIPRSSAYPCVGNPSVFKC